MLPPIIRIARRRDPYVNNGALVEQDGQEAECVDIACLWLISIYLDTFRLMYQQAAEMIIASNIRTQEGNKARTASSHSPNVDGGREAISAFLFIKWRCHCHIKLIWKPR